MRSSPFEFLDAMGKRADAADRDPQAALRVPIKNLMARRSFIMRKCWLFSAGCPVLARRP